MGQQISANAETALNQQTNHTAPRKGRRKNLMPDNKPPTEQLKARRRANAAEYQKKLTAANRLEIRNRDAAKIAAIRNRLHGIPGQDNAEKILYLLDIYEKKTK